MDRNVCLRCWLLVLAFQVDLVMTEYEKALLIFEVCDVQGRTAKYITTRIIEVMQLMKLSVTLSQRECRRLETKTPLTRDNWLYISESTS